MKFINWKTTVAGIIAGLIPIAQTLAATLQTGAAINWTQIGLGVFIMVLGVVAKDFNTTAIALVLALPLLQGCGGSVHDTIEKALVFESTAQTAQAQLFAVADAAIAALPAEKQADARAKLTEANQHLTDALNAKDDALQAALAASDVSQLNLGQITADVVQAIQALVALVNTFGVSEQTTSPIQARMLASQAKALAK